MKSYTGLISEKKYLGMSFATINTKEHGILIVDALVQEFIDDGKVYRITISEVEEDHQNISSPITAEREFVPV